MNSECLLVGVDKANGFLKAKGFNQDKLVKSVSVVVHKQDTLPSGEVGLFALNEKLYLKRYMVCADKIILSEPETEPIVIRKSDEFKILGKALEWRIAYN